MYRISGNYDEFAIKVKDAIFAIVEAIEVLSEGNLKTYVLFVADAYRDCLRVRASRSGVYGAELGGSALIALNDKYNLGNVSESSLDDKIFEVGISYLKKALDEAKRSGISIN